MAFWKWSRTASSNATADNTINWAEGMAPSAVNDSARAMMARLAEWRDDISGTIATAGTSTAYTVASNQGFDSLAHLGGAMIAFVPPETVSSLRLMPSFTLTRVACTSPYCRSPQLSSAAWNLIAGMLRGSPSVADPPGA